MARPLPTELEGFVERAVRSGKYRSRDEVFHDALRLLRERERRRDALEEDIAVGLDELDRGEGQLLRGPGEVSLFFKGVREEARRRSRKGTPQK